MSGIERLNGIYGDIRATMELILDEDPDVKEKGVDLPGFTLFTLEKPGSEEPNDTPSKLLSGVITSEHDGVHYLYLRAPEHTSLAFGSDVESDAFSGTNTDLYSIPSYLFNRTFTLTINNTSNQSIDVAPTPPPENWNGIAPLAKKIAHSIHW